MVVLTPEGYDNLHTGDSHRSPICHTGDSHRSRFVTPEPSHRRRVDHTGPICSAHTGISTQQNFARPDSGVTLAGQAAEIQRKVASKRRSASSMQERGRDRDEKEERREKREKREEKAPTSKPSLDRHQTTFPASKRLDYCWSHHASIALRSRHVQALPRATLAPVFSAGWGQTRHVGRPP